MSPIDRHPGTQHLIDLLEVNPNLPVPMAAIAQRCEDLAIELLYMLQDGPELTTGLRKLLEAKDCFVRQAVVDRRSTE
jgi:hypothetical protein